jgi:hypothetical protein
MHVKLITLPSTSFLGLTILTEPEWGACLLICTITSTVQISAKCMHIIGSILKMRWSYRATFWWWWLAAIFRHVLQKVLSNPNYKKSVHDITLHLRHFPPALIYSWCSVKRGVLCFVFSLLTPNGNWVLWPTPPRQAKEAAATARAEFPGARGMCVSEATVVGEEENSLDKWI